MFIPTYPSFFDIETRTAKPTAIGVTHWLDLMPGSTGKFFDLIWHGCIERGRKVNAEAKPSMWYSCSRCWFLSTCTIWLTKGLNTRSAIGSPSCVFWDCNWKTGYLTSKRSGCSGNNSKAQSDWREGTRRYQPDGCTEKTNRVKSALGGIRRDL